MTARLLTRRTAGAVAVVLLAGCIHIAPSVAPTGTLAPADAHGSGPRTGSAFAVAWAGPRGEVADRIDPAITVLFNRGMRSLDTPEDQNLPRLDVRTKEGAPIAGALRWVGTRGLLFVPDKPLPGASRVLVTVPGDTKTLDGTALGAPYSFELATPKPVVARTFPNAGATSLKPDASFVLVMNQDVAPEALQEKLRVVLRRADGDAGEAVHVHVTRAPATPNQRSDEQAFRVTPDRALPLDVGVELTIAEGLRGSEGPMTMEKPFHLGVRTYGPLKLASFRCPRIAREGRCKAHNDIRVTMSNPVAPEELRRHLKAPGLLAKPNPKAIKRPPPISTDHWLLADPQLGRKYTVTLTAGMKDVFGQALASDTSFEVEAEAPFSGAPAPADAKAAGKHGTAKHVTHRPPPAPARPAVAAAPVPTVPHRAQLDYGLQLGLTGTVLEALATNGVKTHKLPIGSVNIPTYQLSTSRIAEAQALAWLGGTSLPDFLARNHIQSDFVTPTEGENVRAVRTVDLDALLGKSARGAALVALGVPGESSVRQTMIRVTDLGVTAKASRLGSLVWVTSLATGKPVSGATVSLRTPEKGEVVALTTDAQGMAEIPADRFDPFGDGKDTGRAKPPAFLFVRSGDDWTFERMQRSSVDQRAAAGLQDFNAQAGALGMTYTDRGVYRPGETVKVAGMFRSIDVTGMHAIAGDEVRVDAQDGTGEVVASTRIPLDRFGAFSASLALPKSAHLGDARVVASVKGRAHDAEAVQLFRIAAYKASEFKVEVDSDAKTYVRGDDAVFSVKAEFLFGGAMVGATARTTLTRATDAFTPPGAEGFAVSDEAGAADDAEVNLRQADLGASDDKLDAEGRAPRKLKLVMPGQRVPERVTFEAEVEDMSRQTVDQRVGVLVHPAEFYVAIKKPRERFVSAGGPLHVDLAAIEPSGAHRAGAAVKVELFERKWTAAAEEHGDGAAHRTSRLKDELVGNCDLRTTAALVGCDLKVPDVGLFIVRASSKDARGNEARASESLYAVEDTPRAGATVAWADDDTRVVRLETNKKTFDVGESARVLVKSPFRDAVALVTVERGGVLSKRTVHVSGPMPVIDVPVTAEMYPNAYVAVHLLRGRIAGPPEKGADLGGPEFRLGYAELDVNPDAHRLAVTVTPARKEYGPGDEIDVELAVKDREGKPAESELTFFAVDEGVLMLTGYKTPDPLPAFARRRSLGVFTVESREDLAHVTPLHPGERVANLGYDYLARSGDKGDPGGGGSGPLRADFRTTAYFEAGKITDKEGKAKIHFKLPDNLTSFRLMAVAAGGTDFFGAGDAKITTSKKLMARPALPRLLRVGDEFSASIVVTAKELVDADVDVALAVTNLVAKGPASQRVRIPKSGSIEVRFPVAATAPGEATFEARVSSGTESDRVRVTRKVEVPLSSEMVAAYGETRDAASISLGDLSSIRPDQGELRLRAAPTALVGLSTSMEQLLDYPYGCTEQLSSRTLPLASLSELAKDFGVRLPANVPHAIEEAVDAILKNQREDGGFGFWENSPRSEPWLSAYVALTLDAAKKSGAPVSASALDSAVSYLRAVLGRTRLADADAEPEAEQPAEPPPDRNGLLPEEIGRIDYANAAFIADALATIGSPDPGALTRLYDARKGKPLGARASLLHAMVAAKTSPDPVTTLAKELEADLRIDANEAVARFDDDPVGRAVFESTARTTALVLRALVAADKHHPLAPRLARGLLGLRQNGAWRSTQENGWALLALRDYRVAQESSKNELEARAFLGRDMVSSRVFQGMADAELNAVVPAADVVRERGPIAFQLVGEGQLFYAAELRYTTAVLPKVARDEGLFVKKLVRALKPEEIQEAVEWIPKQSADAAPAGSLVLVDLLLESAEARKQVVIDDPLPAGLEPIDAALDTASKSRAVQDDDGEATKDKKKVARPGALTGIGAAFRSARAHREMHDDRVLTFVEELPPGMYHFRYLARATSVGRFVVPPTRVAAMYTPEVWGSTAAGSFEVRATP